MTSTFLEYWKTNGSIYANGAVVASAFFAVVVIFISMRLSRRRATLDIIHSNEADAIRNILNHYEFISIGIKHGILDELFYARWFYSTIIKDHTQLKPYIAAVRNRDTTPSYYIEFEKLAMRWEKFNHPKDCSILNRLHWKYDFYCDKYQHIRMISFLVFGVIVLYYLFT